MKNLIVAFILITLIACQPADETNKDIATPEDKPSVIKRDHAINTAEEIEHDLEAVQIPVTVDKQDLSTALPQSVIAFIQLYRKECGQDDQLLDYKAWVQQADITADQKMDYILEPAQFMCDDPNMMYGRGGTEIFVFGEVQNSEVKQLFSHVMFGYELTAKTEVKPQQLWLKLGGGFCGQDMDQISTSEAISCRRLVGLNSKTHVLELTDIELEK